MVALRTGRDLYFFSKTLTSHMFEQVLLSILTDLLTTFLVAIKLQIDMIKVSIFYGNQTNF